MVLGHELAHVKRGDLSWGLVASLVRALFFFHPLVWWSERWLKLTQEVAADELAIAQQRHDPASYGELLVSVVGKLGHRPMISAISVETAGTTHLLARRLVAMARIGRTSRRVVVTSSTVLGTVVFIGLVPWQLVAAEPQQDKSSVQQSPVHKSEDIQARQQRDAAKAIEKLGGSVAWSGASLTASSPRLLGDDSSNTVVSVDLSRTRGADAGLQHLKVMHQVEQLWLIDTDVTDSGLQHLEGLSQLRVLALENTHPPTTDVGLEHLKALRHLKELYLGDTQVTDAGLEYLKGLSELQVLYLNNTLVTAVGVDRLQKALPKCRIVYGHTPLVSTRPANSAAQPQGKPSVPHLPYSTPQVSAPSPQTMQAKAPTPEGEGTLELGKAGVALLKELSPLQTEIEKLGGTVHVSPASMGVDDGLAYVRFAESDEPRNLVVLVDLSRSKVTDAGLEHLEGLMTKCQFLSLAVTHVTDAGLEHLKGLTNLQMLCLRRTQVTDAGLEHLKGLNQLILLDLL